MRTQHNTKLPRADPCLVLVRNFFSFIVRYSTDYPAFIAVKSSCWSKSTVTPELIPPDINSLNTAIFFSIFFFFYIIIKQKLGKMTISPDTGLSYLDSLKRDGFVRIPNVLSKEQIEELRAAAHRSVDLARNGKWPYIRTLPKQFPPWGTDPSEGIWGIQHLMNPELPDHTLFTASYFNDTVRSVVKELLEDDNNENLVMELYNMLIRPDNDFSLRWHRDDVPPTATAEEEVERLSEPAWHAQWNLPLYPDRSLIVVPGSHNRARTDAERNADPYADELPDMKVVDMQPGDVIFYDNNILHRGVYDSSVERMTLHGSMGHVNGKEARPRNVLQHGVGNWVEKIDLSGLTEQEAKIASGMRDRLLEMGAKNQNVGFSQGGDE